MYAIRSYYVVSLSLRSGVDPKMVVKQLKGISCHLPAWAGNGGKIMSCADAVAKAIEWYIESIDEMFAGLPGPARESPREARGKNTGAEDHASYNFV